MEQEAYRHVPYDIDVEQALLGAILVDNSAMERASALIKADHFYDPLHGRIFHTMALIIEQGVVVTPLILHANIKSDPGVIETGGQAYFDALRAAAPALPNIKALAEILIDLAMRRSLIRIGEDIVNTAYDAPTEKTSKQQIVEAECALAVVVEDAQKVDDSAIRFIDVSAWEGTTPPEREWAVLNRIPARCVTLLSGEGGTGKSLLSLQSAVATVVCKDWLGVVPRQGPAMVVCCEDDEDELHRRLSPIAEYYETSFARLREGLYPMSLKGKDTIFGAPQDQWGLIKPTPLFHRIRKLARSIQPSVIVLDNSADIFGGNENDRAQVRQFINLLNEIAMEGNSGLMLTSHPSLTGIATGTGTSGNTAWNASVRARMYFHKPQKEKDFEADPDERVLEVMKSNYGPPGEVINLRWQNGLFVPTEGPGWIDKRAAAARAEEMFLRLLARYDGQGRNVSDKNTAHSYAPTEFAKDPEAVAARIRKPAFADAMRRLFAANRIHVETYGRPSRPYTKLALGPHL
jgi:RecA-family ATPase